MTPAFTQTQTQDRTAALDADDGANDQDLGPQPGQAGRFIVDDFAVEVGHEIEQEADQAKAGFGAVEGLQTKTVGAEILLELLDAVLALGMAIVEALGLHRVKAQRGNQ